MKLKKELMFFCAIVFVGLLDWFTTFMGVTFFGAKEINPLISGLISSSTVLFSVLKLFAVTITGLAFYKAAAISNLANLHLTKRFLDGSYSVTLLALSLIVVNNIIILLKF
jgi:hypothetical protein